MIKETNSKLFEKSVETENLERVGHDLNSPSAIET